MGREGRDRGWRAGCRLQSARVGRAGGSAESRGGLGAIGVRARRSPWTPWLPAPPQEPQGFDNKAFLTDDEEGEANWAPAPSTPPPRTQAEVPAEVPVEVSREPLTPEPPAPPLPTLPAPASPSPIPEPPTVARDEGGPAGVRSILTKERRPEGGYKAVWFGENIGAEADVVVLNAPTSDADRASDSGSVGSGDEGDGASDVGASPYTSTHDSTYI